MIYWWLSPSDSPTAEGTIVGQLIDSAENSESRGQYYPKTYSMSITPHCDEIQAQAPKRWSELDRRMRDGEGIGRQAIVSDFFYSGAEAQNLSKNYSINQMALLTACMEATPFGKSCRDKVNEVRWDHERSEQYLIKSGFLSKVNGNVCVNYPEIIFKSQDQQ